MLPLLGLAKGALDGGGLLGGILQTGADLLGEIFKGGEQQQTDPFNSGSTENGGLLNACQNFNGNHAALGNPGEQLKNFLNVAKTLLDSLSENANANAAGETADKPAEAQTAKIKELLEKLVQAFEKLAENQNANNAAPANDAAQSNAAEQPGNAAPSNNAAPANNADQANQAANQAENGAAADAQNPLQQITDLLKQLFKALTGKDFDAENKAADASNGAANNANNAAANNANNAQANAPASDSAANSAEAQNPLQQIADLLKQLLDEIKNKQGAQNADGNQARANNADQANQANQATQNSAAQQADGSGEPEAAKLENAVQQVLQLLQNLLQAFQGGAANQQPANNAQNRNLNVDNNSVRTPGGFETSRFSMIAEQRFEAHMTARV